MPSSHPCPPPKIKEFELSEEIKQQGFTSICTIAKTLVLQHESGAIVQSQHYSNDLLKTTKELRNNIVSTNELHELNVERFIVSFSQLVLKSAETEYAQFQA